MPVIQDKYVVIGNFLKDADGVMYNLKLLESISEISQPSCASYNMFVHFTTGKIVVVHGIYRDEMLSLRREIMDACSEENIKTKCVHPFEKVISVGSQHNCTECGKNI